MGSTTLPYSPAAASTSRLAAAYAIVSVCVGVGGNVWGALTAWAIHAGVAPSEPERAGR